MFPPCVSAVRPESVSLTSTSQKEHDHESIAAVAESTVNRNLPNVARGEVDNVDPFGELLGLIALCAYGGGYEHEKTNEQHSLCPPTVASHALA